MSPAAWAQPDHTYTDAVRLRGGRTLSGKLVDYTYGEAITMERSDGQRTTIPWRRVVRVYFEVDREQFLGDSLAPPPTRRWQHQVTATTGLSRTDLPNSQFGTQGRSNVGAGAAYHYVRPLGPLLVGAGGGAEVMSAVNDERLLQLTALVEYQLGSGRLRPLARLLAGGNLPLGHPDLSLSSRAIGSVIHPSVGIALLPPVGHWGILLFDLGYRFTGVEFTTVDPNFELVTRRVNYRRLVFTLGTRF